MDALATATTAPVSPDDAWQVSHAPPRIDLAPFTRAELGEWFRGGEAVADDCEKLLAWSARVAGGLDLAIAEGLHALRQGDRLAELGCHLDDYAREVLDIGRRTAESLVRLGGALRTRPLLREALGSGRVGIRAAETVLPVAVGESEALWVDRAASQTVRELEDAVRRARASPEDAEDEWLRLRTHLPPEERAVVDVGLEVARELMPGSSRVEGLEALAQEYLAEFSTDGDADETRPLGACFRASGRGRDSRRAALEVETERWAALPSVAAIAAPDVRFYETATAQDIDRRLRELARLRAGWDDVIGYCAHVVRRSGMHTLLGFATFRQYVEERLRLPARAVEQREALEKRLWESPALQEGRRQGLSYEMLRVLSRLPEPEIGSWIPRACDHLHRAQAGGRRRARAADACGPEARGPAPAPGGGAPRGRRRARAGATRARALHGNVPRHHRVPLREHLERRGEALVDAFPEGSRARRGLVPGARVQSPRRPLPPRPVPLARRERRSREPGRALRVPSPPLHPRRTPRGVRAGAGCAHVDAGREGVGGAVADCTSPARSMSAATALVLS